MWLLSQHLGEQHRLQAESDEVLGDNLPKKDDLNKLRYTRAVVQESMRLIARMVVKPACRQEPFS